MCLIIISPTTCISLRCHGSWQSHVRSRATDSLFRRSQTVVFTKPSAIKRGQVRRNDARHCRPLRSVAAVTTVDVARQSSTCQARDDVARRHHRQPLTLRQARHSRRSLSHTRFAPRAASANRRNGPHRRLQHRRVRDWTTATL